MEALHSKIGQIQNGQLGFEDFQARTGNGLRTFDESSERSKGVEKEKL